MRQSNVVFAGIASVLATLIAWLSKVIPPPADTGVILYFVVIAAVSYFLASAGFLASAVAAASILTIIYTWGMGPDSPAIINRFLVNVIIISVAAFIASKLSGKRVPALRRSYV